MNRLNRLPTSFSIDREFSSNDTRFLEITIDILHTGKNFNDSNFDKGVVESAIPSLYNTPILGYIHRINGDIDFRGHEHEVLITNDGIEDKYLCVSYGVIPESSKVKWITKVSEDGRMREYLQASALIWTKFEDVIDIFERDGEKPHSMELELNSIQGNVDSDGVFNFTAFKFDGCCILGEGVQPAMISSKAVANFSVDKLSSYIQKQLNEFSAYTNDQSTSSDVEVEYEEQNPKEGGNAKMDEKTKILEKYGLTIESVGFMDDELSLEEFEAKVKEFSETNSDDNTGSDTNEDESKVEDHEEFDSEEDKNNETDETPAVEFALEGQFKDELLESLSSEKVETDFGMWPKYSYVDYDKDTSEIYCFDAEDFKLYGFKFEVTGDKVEVDFASKSRKKFAIVDFVEGSVDSGMAIFQETVNGVIFAKNEKFNAVQAELDEVKTKYEKLASEIETQNKEQELAEKKEFVAQFEKELSDVDEFSELTEKLADFTMDELEVKCFAMVGKKKANFSVEKPKTQAPKIPVEKPEKKPVSKVPYAHLFEE